MEPADAALSPLFLKGVTFVIQYRNETSFVNGQKKEPIMYKPNAIKLYPSGFRRAHLKKSSKLLALLIKAQSPDVLSHYSVLY